MKYLKICLISAGVGFVSFVTGLILQKRKDIKATEFAGTLGVYLPPDGEEKPILFAEPNVDVRKILKAGQATFRVSEVKNLAAK